MKKCILALVLLPYLLFSQNETNRVSYGLFGGFDINSHSADFKKIPDCPSCSPGYRDGSGLGMAFGLLYEYPVNNIFIIGMRATYYDFSGLLKADESTTLIVNGVATNGVLEHTIDAKLSSIGIEPLIKINILSSLNVTLGIHLGSIMSKSYSQKEQIIEPSGIGTFLDSNGNDTQKRIRNVFSGDFQKPASLYLAPFGGISYQLPLNKNQTWFIEPEIFYYLGLTNIVDDAIVTKWTANTLRAGLAIKYSPKEDEKIIDKYEKIEKIDTIKIESDIIAESRVELGLPVSKTETILNDNINLTLETISRTDTLKIPKLYAISGDIKAVGVDKKGTEIDNPKLIIEEFETAKLAPLLNYMFFDEKSTNIPSKYKLLNKQDISKFEIDSLYNSTTLEIYYNIMNIVGKRLTKFPDAKLTLMDCIGGSDLEKDKNVSGKWAEPVKLYLENVWGIDKNRIKIISRNLPEKPSTPLTELEKIEENRRVELSSNDYRITEPVFIENIERKSNIPVIRFKLTDKSEAGIAEWNVKANQKSNTGQPNFRQNEKNILPEKVEWIIEKEQNLIPLYKEPISYQLKLIDNKGKSYITTEKSLPFELLTIKQKRAERKDDYEIQKFSLILFDFDKSDIAGQNKKIIDLIKSRIKPESVIEIKGYTDRTGDEDYNLKLSERRAKSAQSVLGRNDAETTGIGKQELLYDNNIPEGRFYCRTVEITVKTKVK